MKKKAIIFISGRGSNSITILNAVKDGYLKNLEINMIISDNSNAPGLKKAKKAGFNAIFVNAGAKKSKFSERGMENYLNLIRKIKPDYIFLAGFMRIIPERIIKSVKYVLNIHPSLLPSFKGLDVQKQALDYGVKISGCTVHFVDTNVDNGPIIIQRVVPVFDNDTVEILSQRILKEEHKAYTEAIWLLINNKLKIRDRIVEILE